MPLWSGPNWKEEKSLNRFLTGTMLKSQKNWDEDGNHFQVSFKQFIFVIKLIGKILNFMIDLCHSVSYVCDCTKCGNKYGKQLMKIIKLLNHTTLAG